MKPFGPSQHCGIEEHKDWVPIIPRDASLSDSYTSFRVWTVVLHLNLQLFHFTFKTIIIDTIDYKIKRDQHKKYTG